MSNFRVDLIIDDPDVQLPIPFWANHGDSTALERGRHALRVEFGPGGTPQDAEEYALSVFPEARVLRTVPVNVLGEPIS